MNPNWLNDIEKATIAAMFRTHSDAEIGKKLDRHARTIHRYRMRAGLSRGSFVHDKAGRVRNAAGKFVRIKEDRPKPQRVHQMAPMQELLSRRFA